MKSQPLNSAILIVLASKHGGISFSFMGLPILFAVQKQTFLAFGQCSQQPSVISYVVKHRQ